jgi:hypothetical protein
MPAAKLDKQLVIVIDHFARTDPTRELDVIATPVGPGPTEVVARDIEQRFGAVATPAPRSSLKLRLPAAAVRALADSGLVGAVRLMRMHRIH